MNQLQSTHPTRWIAEGIRAAKEFEGHWISAKLAAMNAGFWFIKARAASGERFGDLLAAACGDAGFVPRTAYRYMELAEAALAWAEQELGDVSADKLQDHARQAVMQSPREFVALLREGGFMRKFGEYDAVKYNRLKNKQPHQLTFSFRVADEQLDALTETPDLDQLAVPSLTSLHTKLTRGLARVEEALKMKGAIDVG